jgi:geranylgeranyl diphosphate synthase type II
MAHAVFPGGNRLRPRLCLAVAQAESGAVPPAGYRAAASLELLHCSSLVHDDLPCLDDADLRRGRPAVHRAFGEATAVLAGDALIVLAFEALGRGGRRWPAMLAALARAFGPRHGVAAGQAWELEPAPNLARYHAAKTGALFEAAVALGALAVDADPGRWRRFGRLLGRAYQAADDLLDAAGDAGQLGKPVGRDEARDRPSVVREYGFERARALTASLFGRALAAIPSTADPAPVRHCVERITERLAGLGILAGASPAEVRVVPLTAGRQGVTS